jgi:hypothetical protein
MREWEKLSREGRPARHPAPKRASATEHGGQRPHFVAFHVGRGGPTLSLRSARQWLTGTGAVR